MKHYANNPPTMSIGQAGPNETNEKKKGRQTFQKDVIKTLGKMVKDQSSNQEEE